MTVPNRELRTVTSADQGPSIGSGVDETAAILSDGDTATMPAFGLPAAPGEVGTLGPYRVVRQLGRGGMGAVYLAIDTRLDRKLALKVMLPKFAANPAAKERFLREARAAAQISHDNVVTVYEADERDGVPYIAMQFLQGYPLDDYLRKHGNPTIPQILRIAREMAAGLAAAHKIGLVHRDIKPGNLWLEAPTGRVKVLDFGLAKPVDADIELTKSGAVVGTPAFMSPEQARGEKVDGRTDLFSLGAVMYRLCTGKLPFEGPTTMAVLMALGTQEPKPLRPLNPQVPEPLADLIHQLLVKNPDHRPQTADEVAKRLRTIAEELNAPAQQSVALSQSQPQVVYVPIQVTAPPESGPNAFADLDATEAEPLPPDAQPVRKKPAGKKGLLIAASFAALAIAIAVVIIIIKNRDGTETKIEVPDGSTVTLKDKDGKTLAVVGPGTKGGTTPDPLAKKTAESDLDKQAAAARWLFENKKLTHWMVIEQNGKPFIIKSPEQVPAGPFRVLKVGFHPINNGGNLKEEDVPRLAAFTDLEELGLFTFATDAGLESLLPLKNLRRLELGGAKLTLPEAAESLRKFPKLELVACPNDDRWVKALAGTPTIRALNFYRTKLSVEAMGEFKNYPNLTDLKLSECSVAEGGWEKLLEVKTLRWLVVTMKVLPGNAKALAEAMPWCEMRFTDLNDMTLTTFNEGKADPDRKAAEWVLSVRGSVRVTNSDRDIKAATELPKERFTLTWVNLTTPNVTDAGLANLKACQGITLLALGSTGVTDAGLEILKEWKGLTWLNLNSTPVTDAGLAHVKECTELASLDLGNTKVTDTGLMLLKSCKKLVQLDARKTKVTAKGLEEFHAAVPGCRIEHDGGVIEAKK